MNGAIDDFLIIDNIASLENMLDEALSGITSVFVLCDTNTIEHCWPQIASFQCLKESKIIEIEPGEASKSVEISFQLWTSLLEDGADRNSILINLGGGVVTDLGGFIASTFKRGIKFINIPTSLLAMVDASYGGKTGINLNSSKNQIGTFSDPDQLLICPEFLNTLPEDEILSGFGEMVKHGLIKGNDHWNDLRKLTKIKLSSIKLMIKESLSVKKEIKLKDPFEKDIRKFLNLGHTVGHAIETLSHGNGNPLKHGNAIALGIIVELKLAAEYLGLNQSSCEDTINYLDQFYQSSKLNQFDPEKIWVEIKKDKKNIGSRVLFVLLKEIGNPQHGVEISKDQFMKIMKK